ncbi:hypothetical protein ACLOAU_14860 [Niabella sp. CJ426]|jgi:hypothetical protein|uniref:hypothetical protein n=1 Tax=Niabella sp. CJ426 TaxID=3393740 RepID=UPI003D085E9A
MAQLFRSSLKCFGITICTALLVQFFSSCTKSSPIYIGDDTTTNPPKDTTTTPPKDTTTTPPKDTTVKGRSFAVGTGSGNLVIDGNNFVVSGSKIDLKNGDTVKIKGGSYNSMAIKNVSVPATGARVIFINNGQVVFSGGKQLTLSDLNNVTISGAGESATARGFTFMNSSYRAVTLSGAINNFTIQNMLFQNVQDYVICYPDLNSKLYNGAANSHSSNLAFLNLDAYNVGPFIVLGGDITNNGFTGLVKKLEVANILCTNSPTPGAIVSIGDVEDFLIHDNRVDNVNSANDTHNGIFFVRGNGKFYNNVITNHQGNALRLWQYSLNDNIKTIEIYNNIVYNSRKYSGFEIQVPPYIKAISHFRPAKAKVYNNTVGKMNTDKMTFPGRLLDFYNTYSTLELYNNLVFNNNDAVIVNDMSSSGYLRNDNNIYVARETDAVEDLTSFKSKISGTGATKVQ